MEQGEDKYKDKDLCDMTSWELADLIVTDIETMTVYNQSRHAKESRVASLIRNRERLMRERGITYQP